MCDRVVALKCFTLMLYACFDIGMAAKSSSGASAAKAPAAKGPAKVFALRAQQPPIYILPQVEDFETKRQAQVHLLSHPPLQIF